MSILSNSSSGASSNAAEYVSAVLDLLGEQDPFWVLSQTPTVVRDLVAGISDEQLRTPERDGKWSINQVLQHLADSELVWGYRLRRVAAEDAPPLEGFDQDEWAERLGYAEGDPETALQMLEAIRRANLALLAGADLQRYAVHEERGRETLEHMARLYAGHDLAHRRQIERIIEMTTA